MSGRLPDLGHRGEGWFVLQVVFLAAVVLVPPAGTGWPDLLLPAAVVAGATLIGLGGLLALRGVRDLGASLTPFPRPRDDARLVEDGIYRHARHPIYGGLIVAALGWSIVRASPLALLLTIALAVFFALKSRREEAWLSERFVGYDAYRRRTRRFIPRLL